MDKLDADQLAEISRRTLAHYDDRAREFWEGTRDHDVVANREALLRHAPSVDRLRILDLGCGPGRDLIAFAQAGHEPVGLDGSATFCAMAREMSGCEVLHQDMLALRLPAQRFHGVFANASLFHVPRQELPRVLAQLHAALTHDGVLFASNPRGDNREEWHGERYGCYHDLPSWRARLQAAGFTELEHYYRPPGKPRHLQPWLATVFRKTG